VKHFHVKVNPPKHQLIKEVIWSSTINLGVTSALNSKLIAAMLAIEIANFKNWRNLWLETDSMLVYLAFKSSKIVPWNLRNRWDNCLFLLSSLNLCVTHIFREDNQCAYQLANLGLTLSSYSWFNNVPPQVNVKFVRNKIGFPNYRFC